jgi:hypothetical protein
MTLAMGSHMSARKGERFRGTGSGKAGMGRGLFSLAGPKGSPGSVLYFFLFSSFSFSVF